MKMKSTLLMFMAALFIFGSATLNGQTEVWNQAHTWNADRYYRGLDYNPLNNHLYVAGTEGTYVNAPDGTVAEDAKIQVLDASTGTVLKTLSPSTAFGADWGYGIRDVEIDDSGAIFATIGTSNNFNPVQLYYWENEDTEPIQLWKDASGTENDFGGSFSVYGDFNTEALIIIPFVDIAKVYYFEVINGDLGAVNTLDLTGVASVRTPHVQALGTKIADGFWYNAVALGGPVKFDGTGSIVASIADGIITGGNLDVKYFMAGTSEYLAVSNAGNIQVIDITGKAADLSDVSGTDATQIDGTVPTLETVWPHVYGSGQEQAVLANPDGSYAIYSLSGANYVKALATDGAPIATNAKLTGSPLVGEVKTVEYLYIDINADAEATSVITWYVADDAMGTNIAEITANAGNTTYTLDAADAGKYISFTVLPVAATGTVSDALHLATSMPFGPVLAVAEPPVASDAAITGIAQVGIELTGTYTYSDPNMDLEGNSMYKWYRSDVNDGTGMTEVAAGSITYTPVGEDAQKYLAFVVTPVAATGYIVTGDADTAFTAETVLFPPLPPTANDVTISGREDVAATLTASYTYEDLNGEVEDGTVLKWYRADDAIGTNEAEIATATLTYTLVAADEGKFIAFEVTPDNATDDPGTPVKVYTGAINPEPAPVAPVASDVVLSGTPEVDAVLSATYTYSDDIDDPEGVSLYKWYIADDASGTNQTQIASADDQTYLVTEAELGKFIAFEVTPVALTGGALEGTPVLSNYTAAGTVASSNTFGLERLWLASTKTGAAPYYVNPTATTERGFAIGEDYIYIASRYNGTKVIAVNKDDGSFAMELSTTGIAGGIYPINDIEVSDDGQILAAPLNDAPEFWIYKWENELAEPVKWLEVTLSESMRFGDKFSVTGDVSGDAIILAAQANGNTLLRWVVTGGVPGDVEILTLNGLGSMETSPAAVPFSVSADANILIDGKGLAPRIFDKDLNEIGSVAKIDNYTAYLIQSNSPNVFHYKGRTMAAFFQAMRQDPLGARIIIADITATPYQIVDSTEYISNSMAWDGYIGEVDVTTDGDYYYAYMLQAKNAVAAYKGTLELPVFASAITSHDGLSIDVTFDMAMTETGKTDASVWTVTAAGNAIVVDSIHSSDAVITFDLASAIAEGDAVTIAYDGTGIIKAFNSLPLAAFGPEAVENITGAEVPVATDVVISGGERTGETLTGTYTYSDPESDVEGTSLYQWYYADDAAGTNALKIIGEKAMTYDITSDVEGKYIAFEVTPVAATGGMDYLVGTPVMSNYIRIIPTNINDNSMDNINVYPNPVVNILTIDNASNITAISVIDVTGKQIQNISIANESTITVDMSAFNNGLYYIKLQDEAGASSVVKVVKVQ